MRTAIPRPPQAGTSGSVSPKATAFPGSSGRLQGLLDPGEMVGERYEIRYLLGEGPTGVTYRALDHEVEIEIALKVIGAALLPEADVRDRFIKGLSRLTSVSHPNVVKCFEVGVHSGRAFLALQLCEGLSLRKLFGLRQEKAQAFTLADLEPIVTQVARGLTAIHKRGIVAGALRPEDVIVLPDAVKVADAAVWRHLPQAQLDVILATTDAGRYLAPEVKKGGVPDPRADSFSLAVIVQEMLGPADKIPPPLAEVLFEAQKEAPSARMGVEQLGDEIAAIARTGKRAVPKTSPARGVTALPTPAPTKAPPPVPKLDGPTERTTRISEEELAVALQPNRDATRQVKKEELLALRAQSSGDTQQIQADELMPADDEEPTRDEFLLPPTARLETAFTGAPPPKPAGSDRNASFDDMKTIPVEKIGPPELATEAAPVIAVAPPPIPPAAVAPPPPPIPPPPIPPPAPKIEAKKSTQEDPEDDDLTPLPPPMEFITPPGGTPLESSAPTPAPLPPTPPAPPPPSRSNGAVSAPLALQASQPTMRVAPPQPVLAPSFGASVARMSPGLTPSGVVKLVVAFVAATGVALTILWMQQSQHAEQERQAKEKQIELLRLRESQTPSTASPSATTPDATPATAIALPDEGTSAGCPRGAKRNHAEGHDFCIDAYEYPGGHIMPRTGVSWADAEKLCESRNERLCTRREWVASCVGAGGASYPYGNTHDATRCNVDGAPQAAGSFPHCKSPVGTFDMVGNVSEWIADKVIVGGSALRHDVRTRCDSSQKIDPNLRYSDVGFRCCTDAK